ncbi:hypothetical protein ACFL6U_19270 [Planctomycetota bacterium]
MPAGKRQQSNTMLYTVIVFVALFLISTVLAVIFYVKADDYRNREDELQRKFDEFVLRSERSQMTALVGPKESSQSYLGALLDYHNQSALLIMGQPVDSDSAVKVKVDAATAQTRAAVTKAQPFITLETVDPNTGLVPLVNKLVDALTSAQEANASLTQRFEAIEQRYESVLAKTKENEQDLAQQTAQYQKQSEEISQRYDELKGSWEQEGNDRAANLQSLLDQEAASAKQLNQDLLKTRAQLDMTQERMTDALSLVRQVEPVPDMEATTLKGDGKVTLVDEAAGVVYINLGSEDRIFQGLTFSVYDKASAIAKDGKSKAEVEVFKIMETAALARIVSSDPRNPIGTDDVVVNLIWDRDRANQFVLVGDFDLNLDGFSDADAVERITALIQKWGGVVADVVTAETYAVLLGTMPAVPVKPTFEDLEIDPLAQDRYDAVQQRQASFRGVQDAAIDLLIPMYKYEKFLYLIGYKGYVQKPGAFD